jgi:hypothetical protein
MVILDNNQARENELGENFVQIEDDAICENAVTEMTIYTDYVGDDGYLYPLSDVNLEFRCSTYTCDIGTARTGELVEMLPACYNGVIVAEKDGYGESMEVVSTFEEGTVTVVLEEYTNLSYEVKVVDYDGNSRSLLSTESAFISLVNQDSGDTVNVFYPEVTGDIKLVAGFYDVEGILMSDTGFDIEIPEQVLSGCASTFTYSLSSVFGLEDETCMDFDIDAMTLDSMLSGTLELEWEVDREELRSASNVVFYLTEPADVSSEEDIEDLMTLHELGLGMVEPELE